MTAETVTITEILAEYTLDASTIFAPQPNLWQYVIYLGGTESDQSVTFKIKVQGNPWPLQLGEKYVLEFTPVPGVTGGIFCTSSVITTGPNPNGQAGIVTTYVYNLADESNQNQSPQFDGFVLTPNAPLGLVVGQTYTVEFKLAP